MKLKYFVRNIHNIHCAYLPRKTKYSITKSQVSSVCDILWKLPKIFTSLISIFFSPLMEAVAVGIVPPPKPFMHGGKFGLRRVKDRPGGNIAANVVDSQNVSGGGRAEGIEGAGASRGKEERPPFTRRRETTFLGDLWKTNNCHRCQSQTSLVVSSWTRILPPG